jgi:hypothetical protein
MSRNYIQNIKDLVVQTKHQNVKELHSRTIGQPLEWMLMAALLYRPASRMNANGGLLWQTDEESS